MEKAIKQFEQDNEAKIFADASTDVYEVGKPGGKPAPKCLERIEITEENMGAIQAMLKLPEKPTVKQFVDDENGYRAQLYKDHRTGQVIVAFRGTQPESLREWMMNIHNQDPDATDETAYSYFKAAELGGVLSQADPPVAYTGHSKGGGEAYEALGRGSPKSKAVLFNPAAPSPRVQNLPGVANNTVFYQNRGDFLGTMQGVMGDLSARQKLEHAEYLREQIDTGALQMKVDSPDLTLYYEIEEKSKWWKPDSEEVRQLKAKLASHAAATARKKEEFLAELDASIETLRQEAAKDPGKTGGKTLFGKPVGTKRELPVGSKDLDLGSGSLKAISLIRHTMDGKAGFDGVNDGLEREKARGMYQLEVYNLRSLQAASAPR